MRLLILHLCDRWSRLHMVGFCKNWLLDVSNIDCCYDYQEQHAQLLDSVKLHCNQFLLCRTPEYGRFGATFGTSRGFTTLTLLSSLFFPLDIFSLICCFPGRLRRILPFPETEKRLAAACKDRLLTLSCKVPRGRLAELTYAPCLYFPSGQTDKNCLKLLLIVAGCFALEVISMPNICKPLGRWACLRRATVRGMFCYVFPYAGGDRYFTTGEIGYLSGLHLSTLYFRIHSCQLYLQKASTYQKVKERLPT